jgi:CRISPR system Cascade subunit CasB
MTEALFEVTETATGSSLDARVAQMAAIIGAEHYPNGERAALRRWSPEQPIPLAFYRLWLRHLGDDLPPEFQTPAWMTIAWGLATLGKEGHDPRRPLGQALAESQFSEGRFEQLLSAPEDVRPDLFMSAVRFLAAKGERFNWREAAEFLLTQDPDRRESLCRRIATAFYRYQKHQEQ